MTTVYRNQKDNILKEDFRGINILAIAETFDRAAFDAILSEKGCTSLRIYFGMSDDLKIHSIIVGVNANNEDMLPSETNVTNASSIVEAGIRCPTVCGPNSPLNP